MAAQEWKQSVSFNYIALGSNRLCFYFELSFFTIILLSLFTQTGSYAQSDSMNNTTMQQHAEHILDNLIIAEHIPLKGKLNSGDYILLIDLTPFATSVQGHSNLAMKVPCNEDGSPKATIVSGVPSNLNSLDMGIAINNGTLDGKILDLSAEGKSCLYQGELPQKSTHIVLINTSNETLSFDEGGYYSVTFTIHGTAIQHFGANQTAP